MNASTQGAFSRGGDPPRVPTAADWSDALLTSGSEALLGAVRNYIGPVKTPYDKRDLVEKLEAFLRRRETRDSLYALLDALDARIIGSSLLLGPVPEQALKDLFAGELPLFELGVRIANLIDRLLLFRYLAGGRRLIAANPLLEDELRARVLDPAILFGPLREGTFLAEAVDAESAIGFFSYLFHAPSSMRKGGGLTKRAAERAAALFPRLSRAEGDRLGALARAFSASGILRPSEDEERSCDRDAFSRLLSEWGGDLPYFLASCLAIGGSGEDPPIGDPSLSGIKYPPREYEPEDGRNAARRLAIVLRKAMEALPSGSAFARAALARWLRIAARRARLAFDPASALSSLEALGMLASVGGGLASSFRAARPSGAEPSDGRKRGVLIAEGAHALHLMPEASLEERLFVGCVARPVSMGTAWSLEVERETVRRAFAAGIRATEIVSRLESMAAAPLPQSLAFSLAAWEEEYRSLRLYRGFTLVADERQRPVIERSAALGRIVAERLAPGVYFLSAATTDEAIAALAAAGLEAPPLAQPVGGGTVGGFRGPAGYEAAGGNALESFSSLDGPADEEGGPGENLGGLFAPGDSIDRGAARPDPEPRMAELRAALAASGRPTEERRELADRIERRLVLTERQIAQSDPRPERLEAVGLDYLGKVRVVERALRSSGDRLEVLYRLPGAEPVRAVLRPVRLDKNEKGLVLEAEDLGTGGPARVPLGAVSTVRRLRASLFGEDQ